MIDKTILSATILSVRNVLLIGRFLIEAVRLGNVRYPKYRVLRTIVAGGQMVIDFWQMNSRLLRIDVIESKHDIFSIAAKIAEGATFVPLELPSSPGLGA